MTLDISRLSLRALQLAAVSVLLAGCAAAPNADGINDPAEPVNRAVHGVNKGLDQVVVKPAATVYGTVVPKPLRTGLSNVAATLEIPGDVANQLLQGKIGDAATNTLRFGANLTLGLGGLFDFGTAAGMPKLSTDFGETLAVWGVGEGPYVELPILGPSTLRDAVGEVVDIAFDPLTGVLEGNDSNAVTALKVLEKLDQRHNHSDTVDSILYDSADSYAQLRLLYLQNRRYELGQNAGGAAGDAASDAGYFDPYEDPYAQ